LVPWASHWTKMAALLGAWARKKDAVEVEALLEGLVDASPYSICLVVSRF
jgi:hypothetical protein